MLLQHHHSRVCRKSHSQAQRVFKTAPLYAVTNPEPTASGPMPVAAIYDSKHYAIQSDHLNTPRRLVQSDSQVAWQWAYSAFGDEQPTIASNRFANADLNQSFGTTSVPAVTFNLRYPGQYFDQESNLHYNYHRSYHRSGGRYTQADPIGLDGGWNRFGYVDANPLSFTDPLGLDKWVADPSLRWLPSDPARTKAYICDALKNNNGYIDRDKYRHDLSWRDAEHFLYTYTSMRDGPTGLWIIGAPIQIVKSYGYSAAKAAGYSPNSSPPSWVEANAGAAGALWGVGANFASGAAMRSMCECSSK